MRNRVHFFAPDELVHAIAGIANDVPPRRTTVIGYEVETRSATVDDVQAQERRGRLLAALKRSRRTTPQER